MTRTHTVIRQLLETLEEIDGSRNIEVAHLALNNELFFLEQQNWLKVNKKPADDAVPFDRDSILDLPLGSDGFVIPTIPEIVKGRWYEHDISFKRPMSPAAFVDPETLVEWHSRNNGLEENPIKLKDIDWTQCRKYRAYEEIGESVEMFGLF